MKEAFVITWLLRGMVAFFLVLSIEGGAAVLGALLPSDDCVLFLEKTNTGYIARCSPPDGGSCQGGYNCVLEEGTGSYGSEEGDAFWCACEKDGDTRVPRAKCREDVLLGENHEQVLHVSCGKLTCPNPCYGIDPSGMEVGDVLPVCNCPE